LRAFSEIHESRVTYYIVYATEYLLTSEGTEYVRIVILQGSKRE